jgi:hypothetical protein
VDSRQTATKPSWEERVWLHNRHRWWWPLLLCMVLAAWGSRTLFIAATTGLVYGGTRGRGYWISAEKEPASFWFYVTLYSIGLAIFVGLPARIALKIRKRKADEIK